MGQGVLGAGVVSEVDSGALVSAGEVVAGVDAADDS